MKKKFNLYICDGGVGVEARRTFQSNYTRLEVKTRSVQDGGKEISTKKNINEKILHLLSPNMALSKSVSVPI